MFAALGRFVYRRRRLVVAVWAAAFAVAALGAFDVAHQLKGGGFTRPGAPSQQGQRQMQERLGVGPATVTIVFASDTLDARSPAFRQQVRTALSGLRDARLRGLRRVLTAETTHDPGFVSRDGRATFAVLEFDARSEVVQRQLPRLRAALRPTTLTTYITGDPAVYAELEDRSARDLRQAEMYTLPVAAVVLVLIFGTVVAASLPVVAGGMAVTVTLGCFWLLAQAVDISVFAMNVASLLGLAVGIDYALFMVGRFREELAAGARVAAAVETTVATAGRSILFSGLAVVTGLLGLLTIPYMALRSMGLGGSLVVAFSVLAAPTHNQALLGILGPRVDALRVLGRRRDGAGFWGRWSGWVMRHPWPVLVATVAVLLAFAWPVLHIRTEIPGANALPDDSEARRGYTILQTRFDAAALSPVQVVVGLEGGGDPFSPAALERLWAYGRALERRPGVARVVSIVNLPGIDSPQAAAAFWQAVRRPPQGGGPGAAAAAGQPPLPGLLQGLLGVQQREAALRLARETTGPGTVLFRVVPEDRPTSPAAQRLARDILDAGGPPGTRVWVAGVSITIHDFVHELYDRFPGIIALVLCLTAVVLLLFLRSALLPLKAVVVNGLSLLAGYGAMVWVFQDGHLEWLFGFTATGAVDAELPVILFCTVFGVSMDYEVFLLSRMREEWLRGGDNTRAVARGLARTGRIVTSAALMIVVVGMAFAFTSIIITKAIGVGLAVAVALDATVVRVLLVPAVMRLLGRWNWWLPGWLGRRLPEVE